MNSKLLKRIIFLSVLFSFVFGIVCVFAQSDSALEVTYPTTTSGVRPPNRINTFLPRYIKYIYQFAIISGGLIALLVLIYGGFRFMTSTGNPAAISDAREQILSGFLGLIILLGSYIILNELNPDLVNIRIPEITATRKGIIVYNFSASDCDQAISEGWASIPELADIDESVRYKALRQTSSVILEEGQNGSPDVLPHSLYSFSSSDDLVLEFYSNKKCEGDNPIQTITDLQENTCREVPNNTQCIKFVWYIPGIWVFNKTDNGQIPSPSQLPNGWSEGKDYMVFQNSQEGFSGLFHDKIRGIAIVPDRKLHRNYGVVLHNIPGGLMKEKGWAHLYLPGCPSGSSVDCRTEGDITIYGEFANPDASSATVFTLPEPGKAYHSVTACRQDRCEPQKIGDKFHDVTIELSPDSGLTDVSGFFGGKTSSFDFGTSSGIVYAHSFKGDEWGDTGQEVLLQKNAADGISAVIIDQGAPYLVLLCESFIDDFSKFNENDAGSGKYDVAIINQSLPSARTIRMNGRTGTIVVIRTLRE